MAWAGAAGITVHDAASGSLLNRFQGSNPTFALSPDGKWLAREEDSDLVLLPVAAGGARVVLGRHGGTHALAFSPSAAGPVLAAAFADHTTVLWDVAKREQVGTLRGHREKVFDVAFSPDGEWVATGGLDYTTRIWETRTGQNLVTLPGLSSPTFGVKWSPAGNYLAVNLHNAREVALYQITGRRRVQQWLIGHGVELCCVAAHPRLQRLTTSGYRELNSWDLSVAHPSPVVMGTNPGAATALTYSPDGSRLAVAGGKIVIRDANTGRVQGELSGPSPWVYGLAFDPAGGRIASGDLGGNVILWDLATRQPVKEFSTGSTVYSIVFLDSRRLVTHGKGAILLFDLESGKPERNVDLAGGRIRKLVADGARTRLVVGFESGAIGSLSLPDLTPGPRLESAHDGSVACLALSPDGTLLASGSDHQVVLRDAKSFEALLRLPLWDGTLRDVTFDATGRRLVVVGTGDEVDLWDLAALRDGLAEVGRTREAVPHLAALSAANPKDTVLALKVATLQAWFGQEKELAGTRQRILAFARGTSDAATAERAARACSILPSADRAELEAALTLAGAGVKARKSERTLLALGMAEYRSGNYAAADAALLAAAEAGKNTDWVTGISAFYRAMCLFRLGKPDEARKVATAAAAKMKPLPRDEQNPLADDANRNDLIVWLAYKEAKGLIQFDTAPRAKAANEKK